MSRLFTDKKRLRRLLGVLRKIAGEKPSYDKAASAFYRVRKLAKGALSK